MAKSYDFSTDVGKVRFFAAESNIAVTSYTDEEIQGLLDATEGDVYLATSMLWDAKASLAAGYAVKETIGGVSVDPTSTAQYALKMAEHYRNKAGSEPYSEAVEIGGTDFQKREILIGDDD